MPPPPAGRGGNCVVSAPARKEWERNYEMKGPMGRTLESSTRGGAPWGMAGRVSG
jgi:hypothetical protein